MIERALGAMGIMPAMQFCWTAMGRKIKHQINP
jgi:hypothetical protein